MKHKIRKVAVAGTGLLDVLKLIDDINLANRETQLNVIGFLDDEPRHQTRNLNGYKIIGGYDWICQNNDVLVVNSVGRDCHIRQASYLRLKQLGAKFLNLIHPNLNQKYLKIGTGNIIFDNAHLGSNLSIRNNCLILSGAVLGHDCKIGSNCFIGHNAVINGHCSVASNCFIASGAFISPELTLEKNVIVGPNSFVINSASQGQKLVSRPASNI